MFMIFGLLKMSQTLRNPYILLWLCKITQNDARNPTTFFLKSHNVLHRKIFEISQSQTNIFSGGNMCSVPGNFEISTSILLELWNFETSKLKFFGIPKSGTLGQLYISAHCERIRSVTKDSPLGLAQPFRNHTH